MKKIIIVSLILFSVNLYANKFNVIKFTNKVSTKQIDEVVKLTKQIHQSPYARRKLIAKAINSEIMDTGVLQVCKTKPDLCPIAKVAVNIARKSKYADELLATTEYPLDVIRFYSKQGDTFIDTMKGFSVGVSKVTGGHIELLRQKFPNMPHIASSSVKEINDKMITTLRYTGKKGWETSQKLIALAKKYPKSSAIGVLMAWYITDPDSFFSQKEKLINHISDTLREGTADVTKLTLGATQGVADGFITTVKEKLTVRNSIVLFILLFSFIAWKFRQNISEKIKQSINKKKKENTIVNNDDEGLL